jgi:general nucleoside transport system ATP-binding protein
MPGLRMEGISKFYLSSGVLANDSASLRVEDREIHALVGENGAGKSTLMRILYGLEAPDSGIIRVGGKAARIASPAAARALGIGMVQQSFAAIPGFSVAESVVLGAEPRRASFFFDRKRAAREVAALGEENGFRLDPAAAASSLSVGGLQQLEILKLLYRDAEILILDEPTALLAEQETRSLFEGLRRLREAGKTVILITHKVREVKSIADSVTVMRCGRSVARVETKEADEAEIARLMMGKGDRVEPEPDGPRDGGNAAGAAAAAAPTRGAVPVAAGVARRRSAAAGRTAPGSEVFALRSVSLRPLKAGGPLRAGGARSAGGARGRGGRPLVDRVSLSVRAGEVLGVCGMVGSGLGELEDLVSGFARPSSGEVLLEGAPLPRFRTPRLGYVPVDRAGRGACLGASVLDNLVALDRGAFFPRGLADRAKARAFAAGLIDGFSIAAWPDSTAAHLSGGNLQKLALARELAGAAPFLVFSNPTSGLDLASSEFVLERIEEARDRGAAVLLLSTNLDEILALSDRVSVMSKGRIVCELEAGPSLTREALGEYMLGLKVDERTVHGRA